MEGGGKGRLSRMIGVIYLCLSGDTICVRGKVLTSETISEYRYSHRGILSRGVGEDGIARRIGISDDRFSISIFKPDDR